ncbi:hypothetical protein O95_00397 [Bartonella henselae JK 53]|nr:hypothetical protein O95_00397 [Bartonella henselae JK 53]
MGEMSNYFILNKRYIFSLYDVPNGMCEQKFALFCSPHVLVLFSICSYSTQPQTDRRAKMSDLELIKYWRTLDLKTQKELILMLHRMAAAKESKSLASPEERALK